MPKKTHTTVRAEDYHDYSTHEIRINDAVATVDKMMMMIR